MSKYDSKIERITNEVDFAFNFNKTRMINRYMTLGLKFETLVKIKNLSLKLLKDYQKNGGFSIEQISKSVK